MVSLLTISFSPLTCLGYDYAFVSDRPNGRPCFIQFSSGFLFHIFPSFYERIFISLICTCHLSFVYEFFFINTKYLLCIFFPKTVHGMIVAFIDDQFS